MQICLAYQLSGLSVLICIKLIKLYKNEIIQKIQAKWESGLTAVRLKWDPPVFWHIILYLLPLNHLLALINLYYILSYTKIQKNNALFCSKGMHPYFKAFHFCV